MIPTNRVIANCRRWLQQAATNNAFATAFAAAEAAVAPPIPPATGLRYFWSRLVSFLKMVGEFIRV
jgi:hypothetical protein